MRENVGKSLPVGRNGQCKGPEVGAGLVCARNSKKAGQPGMEGKREKLGEMRLKRHPKPRGRRACRGPILF